MLESFLKLISNPILLAIAGGAGGYYLKGKDVQGRTRYLWIGGGAVAGYAAGKLLQSHLQQLEQAKQLAAQAQAATAAQLQAAQQASAATPPSTGEYEEDTVDFDELDIDEVFGPQATTPASQPQPHQAQPQQPRSNGKPQLRVVPRPKTDVEIYEARGDFGSLGRNDGSSDYEGSFADSTLDFADVLDEDDREGRN